MSVLIKTMMMPDSCHVCLAGFGGYCFVAPAETDGVCPDHGRADWCPIIEVPDHGDLIDRDALCIRGGRNCGKMFLAELLKNAPVVILAERNVKVCPLYSDDEVTEYCVEGPCTDEMEGRCPIAERSEDERE